MRRSVVVIAALGILAAFAVQAENPPIKGGCLLGESQREHGLPPQNAEAVIRSYARMYVRDYTGYRREERERRSAAYVYLEKKKWTQEEVIGYTREQREYMYISIGGELAAGRIEADQIPGYVRAVDRQILDMEIELGCEALPDEPLAEEPG